MIAPLLDTIATEYKDKLRVVKLNIDENPKTPPKFNIRGIPTLLLFRNCDCRRTAGWRRFQKHNSSRFSRHI